MSFSFLCITLFGGVLIESLFVALFEICFIFVILLPENG